MWNAGLDEAQAGVKIARRNINNLRYADDTAPMAEREEELKSLLMKVKVTQLCLTLCSQQTEKLLKRWEYQTTLLASWEICMQVKKQQIELDMKQTDSK